MGAGPSISLYMFLQNPGMYNWIHSSISMMAECPQDGAHFLVAMITKLGYEYRVLWYIASFAYHVIRCVMPTDIHQRSHTSFIASCYSIGSHGAQFRGSSGFCQPCMQKQMHSRSSCAIQRLTHVLSSCSDCSRCLDSRTQRTAVILITRKKFRRTLKVSPMPGWR